jgi:hypothetical protein
VQPIIVTAEFSVMGNLFRQVTNYLYYKQVSPTYQDKESM